MDSSPNLPVTVISPPSGWLSLNLPELWRYRDLFWLLVWRDVVARYRQSIIGIGWAVLRPTVSMIIFTFIFGQVAKIQSDGSPYALFTFTGLLPWLYFSGTLQAATSSIVGSSHLLQKVYFPRLILPLVSSVTGLIELAIQLGVLFALMLWFQFMPGWQVVLAPLFIGMAALSAVSMGLWLTALNVKYRDIGQAVPFLIQAWMWLCPIVYPSSAVSESVRPFYALNPIVGVIDGFRWCFLGTTNPDWRMMMISFAVVVMLLVTGLYYFRRVENTFADII